MNEMCQHDFTPLWGEIMGRKVVMLKAMALILTREEGRDSSKQVERLAQAWSLLGLPGTQRAELMGRGPLERENR